MITRAAGAAELRATLSWRTAGEMPPSPTLGEQPNGSARVRLFELDDRAAAVRSLRGEVLALTAPELSAAIERVLRSLTEVAVLSEAVLEARVLRVSPPLLSAAPAVVALARDLLDAGFPVRFGTAWSPAPPADVCLGTGAADGALGSLLREHPAWKTVPAEPRP